MSGKQFVVATCVVLLLGLVPQLAHATFWEGNTSTDWTDSTNWGGGILPNATEDAVIRTGLGTPAEIFGGAQAAQKLVYGPRELRALQSV